MSVEKLPFQIPKSLASYVEQYEKKPIKTIERFHKQLKRRGPDAVGLFIMAWFYHQQNDKEKALEYAIRAKTLAPGSSFLEKAHYFFSHPELFNAWQTDSTRTISYNEVDSSSGFGLNNLIEKLSAVESKKFKIDTNSAEAGKNQQAYDKKEVDSIASETLAKVHEQQGNHADAIRIYQALKKGNTPKADFYEERIQTLEQLKEGK